MELRTLHIRHMCCQRCIEAVAATLTSLGIVVTDIQLGTAIFEAGNISNNAIGEALGKRGFELIFSEEEQLVEEVKIAVIHLIHRSRVTSTDANELHFFLEKATLKPYRLLNKIFLRHTQHTIHKYAILQRIERVKELIEEGRYSFSEIAGVTGYKTPQYLSGQFKKHVGHSMLEYKMNKMKNRKPLDKI